MSQLDREKLRELFDCHYDELCIFAVRLLRDESQALDIVQEVFIRLWEKRDELHIHQAWRPYLYSSVRNRCINELKTAWSRNRQSDDSSLTLQIVEGSKPDQELERKDLENILDHALRSLPRRCYTVFAMSRFGEYSRAEIANELGISVKTVENQITIALNRIRTFLSQYGMLSFLLLSAIPEFFL